MHTFPYRTEPCALCGSGDLHPIPGEPRDNGNFGAFLLRGGGVFDHAFDWRDTLICRCVAPDLAASGTSAKSLNSKRRGSTGEVGWLRASPRLAFSKLSPKCCDSTRSTMNHQTSPTLGIMNLEPPSKLSRNSTVEARHCRIKASTERRPHHYRNSRNSVVEQTGSLTGWLGVWEGRAMGLVACLPPYRLASIRNRVGSIMATMHFSRNRLNHLHASACRPIIFMLPSCNP